MPINSAIATASATKGPVSVNTRKNDLGFGIRLVARDREGIGYNSGIRPQAGRFSTINRASAAAVKASPKYRFSRLLPGAERAVYRPLRRSSTSAEANPSAGAPIEAWK